MHPYTHVRTEDGRQSLTVFMPSGAPIVATGDHPQFDQILEGAQSDIPADDLRALADLSTVVARRFEALSERVAVSDGRVFFDGDEVDSTITKQIVRCLEDSDAGDWKPLVLFMENIAANPNDHSREQLFDWLRDREFTITSNGCFIAFKGVSTRDADAEDAYPYQSCSHRGAAIVNGERFEGAIPNGVGATVEMPRSDVNHDPSHGCSTGLHVGTYAYAQGYARGALLTVMVNPRDVVSVPTDCNAEKMRVCRYVVSDDEATPPEEASAIVYDDEGDGEDIGPRKLYPVPGNKEIFPTDFYTKSGEVRPPKEGEHYLWAEGEEAERVCIATWNCTDDFQLPIMVPTEPQHGDEKVEDGNVQFYADCPVDEEDRGQWEGQHVDRASFNAYHVSCRQD